MNLVRCSPQVETGFNIEAILEQPSWELPSTLSLRPIERAVIVEALILPKYATYKSNPGKST